MQIGTTASQAHAARIIGVIAGALIAVVLVMTFVATNLGIGFEGAGSPDRLPPPPVTLIQ